VAALETGEAVFFPKTNEGVFETGEAVFFPKTNEGVFDYAFGSFGLHFCQKPTASAGA
jgi:hypothetical protein